MTALAHVGGPLGCIGLAVLLVARPRVLRLAGLAALGLGVLFLAVYLAPKGHHLAYVAAGLAGVVVAIAGAVLLRRWPWLLAGLTLLLAPARVPVTVGSTEANLLIPLYVVVAAAGVLLAWELVRDGERSRELGPVALPLALFVAWTGLSLSWAVDLKQGAVQLLFFYLPFGLLALSLARLPWRPSLARVLYVELAAMAVLFTAVGLYQRAAHHVFWNPKVIVGNAYQSFFRVNSLFWDPSIYGRFLVVAVLTGLAVVLWTRDLMKDYKVYPHYVAFCSPLVVGDLVYVVTGNGRPGGESDKPLPQPKAPSFVAVNKKDGTVAWTDESAGRKTAEHAWPNKR